MKLFLYKWLPAFFGCHCRPDRSFHFRGKQFPICARCTGELVGFIAAVGLYTAVTFKWIILILMMLPMLIDGIIQQKTTYESNNKLRFITGILFGYAALTLIIMSLIYVNHLGQQVGAFIKQN